MTQSLNPSICRVLLPHILGGAEMPDTETVAAYKRAIANPSVETLIAACRNELLQLVTEAAAEHFAHASVQGAAASDTTPAQWLEVQLGMLGAEIDLSRKERRTAADRRRAEREAAKPLTEAITRVCHAATMEREAMLRRLDTLRSTAPRPSRIQALRAAGLGDEEISRLNIEPAEEEERQAAEWRQRIAVLDAQLAKCRAYGEDPLHDPEHVRGLLSDELIDAQLARSTAAA